MGTATNEGGSRRWNRPAKRIEGSNGGARRDGLRIAITVDPYIPVPPVLYGGIERVVDLLVRGLVARGHTVTLFAHPDSRTPAVLCPYGVPPHTGVSIRARELLQVGRGLRRLRQALDVVHSFGRLAALLPILREGTLAKIQSYQRAVPWTGVRRAARLAGGSLTFTGCSTSLYAPGLESGEGTGRWHTVFNGVDVSRYAAVASVAADAPLMFLGRLERIKGVHHAVAIAKAAGRRLVIAGNLVTDGPDARYFDDHVAPHVDGRAIEYVGAVDDDRKNALLGAAAALLMPIEWEEPFGIVMAEAMACGTPVIGFHRGSVPEVVRPGVNGFICRTVREAAALVPDACALDRRLVRADCEARFSQDAVVSGYERIYREVSGEIVITV